MKQGDFTALANNYKYRAGYSRHLLDALAKYTGAYHKGFKVADIGAGTGKLTEILLNMELDCVAVEPNDAMRCEGEKETRNFSVEWKKGSGEETGLDTASVNWVIMASSFHWVDIQKGLSEFDRILKPGGFFTCIWNPRDIESSEFHMRIESEIQNIVPDLNRVSSGGKKYTKTLNKDLVSTGHFKNVLFMEASHELVISPERYLGAWKSVNDIQAQAGEERWQKILDMIADQIEGMKEIIVPYKSRAWTVNKLS